MVAALAVVFAALSLGLTPLLARNSRREVGQLRPTIESVVRLVADGEGKFVKYGDEEGDAPQAFGPLGCLCGGLKESELEKLGAIVDDRSGAIGYIPMALIADEDLDRSLHDVLNTVVSRDAILPDTPAVLDRPLILFSGLNTDILRTLVGDVTQAIVAGDLPEETACAVAVPRAMARKVREVYADVVADQLENRPPGTSDELQ